MASRTVTQPRLPAVGGVQSLKGALEPAFKCLWGGSWVPITSQAGSLPPVYPLYTPCIPPVFPMYSIRVQLALPWLGGGCALALIGSEGFRAMCRLSLPSAATIPCPSGCGRTNCRRVVRKARAPVSSGQFAEDNQAKGPYHTTCDFQPLRAGMAAATSRAATGREAEKKQGVSNLAVGVPVGTVVPSGRTC
jgi:hypothetical protein